MRENGLKATKGRLEVLKLFIGAGRPIAQKEIMAMARLKLDRASVYRVLNAFLEAGIIHKAYMDGRHAVFELPDSCGEDHCHPHFSCRGCGATTCLKGMKVYSEGSPGKGFTMERQKVLIEGLCPRCSS